jgi:hypothetical protein
VEFTFPFSHKPPLLLDTVPDGLVAELVACVRAAAAPVLVISQILTNALWFQVAVGLISDFHGMDGPSHSDTWHSRSLQVFDWRQ